VIAALLLAAVVVAGAGEPVRDRGRHPSQIRALLRLASEPSWQRPAPSREKGQPASRGTALDRRLDVPVALAGVPGAEPLPGIEGPPPPPGERGADEWTSVACSTWVFRRFLAGDDTLGFTAGHSAEECSDVPRLIVRGSGVTNRRVPLWPLDDRNVVALWLTPHYVVFGLETTPEGGPTREALAVWPVGSHEWYWTPDRGALNHRMGFDLTALLPDWRGARVLETRDTIVLLGAGRALALRPRSRSWSLVDAASGRPLKALGHRTRRSVFSWGDAQPSRPALLGRLRAIFAGKRPELDSVEILETMSEPCSSRRSSRALLAHALPSQKRLTTMGQPTWPYPEQFGIFVTDSAYARVEATLGMVQGTRWLDCTAYFDLEAADESVVVWTQGATYGDDHQRASFPCGGPGVAPGR
jgi:hypothetical protein